MLSQKWQLTTTDFAIYDIEINGRPVSSDRFIAYSIGIGLVILSIGLSLVVKSVFNWRSNQRRSIGS